MATLSDQIQELAQRISSRDSSYARRLERLSAVVEDPALLDRRATMDLFGDYDPARLEYSLQAAPLPRWIHIIEWLRNTLILLPICLTWWGLGLAARNYVKLTADKPDSLQVPFLSLWENDFPGLETSLLSPTFSEVALADFLLLSIILVLTFVVHYYRDLLQEQGAGSALELRRELDDVLHEVADQLAETRHRQSSAQAMRRFEGAAEKLVEQLEAEQARVARLSARQEKELQALVGATTMLESTTRNLSAFSSELKTQNDTLRQVISDLASNVVALPGQQLRLIKLMEGLGTKMGEVSTTLVQVGRQLESSLDEIGDSSTALGQEAQAAAADFAEVRILVEDLATRIDSITTNLAVATTQADAYGVSIQESVDKLTGASQSLIRQLSSQAGQASEQSQAVFEKLEGVGDSVQTAGHRLDQSAETIATRVDELTDFLKDRGRLNEEFADRLETLGSSLEAVTRNADQLSASVQAAGERSSEVEAEITPSLDRFAETVRQLTDTVQEFRRTLQDAGIRTLVSLPRWLRRG